MCSIHKDDVALSVCLNTKELLCFNCSMEKVKSSDRNIVKEIAKLSDKPEKLLLMCILAKQKVAMKQHSIDKYREKTKAIKENINDKVCKFYDQLLEKLRKMRDDTFDSIETNCDLFLKTCNDNKKELETLAKTIDEQLDRFSGERKSDAEKIEHENVMGKINKINGYETIIPDGSFIQKSYLEEAISKSENSLGEVKIFNLHIYDESVPSLGNENKVHSDVKTVRSGLQNTSPSGVSSTSEEDCEEKRKVIQHGQSSNIERPTSEGTKLQSKRQASEYKDDGAKSINIETKDSSKLEKSRSWGFFRKDKTSEKLQELEDVEFIKGNLPQARHLVNTTKSLSQLPTQFRTPFKFSKLVSVGPRRLVLLSKEHSSIFVIGLDGMVQDFKTYDKDRLVSIVGMADDTIAVLKDIEAEIEIIQISDQKFQLKSTIQLSMDISEFTGLDYTKTKSQFAIGTEGQYVLIDKKGKTVKTKTMESMDNFSDIMTLFDFEKSNIFVIKKTTKSIKCVSFKGAKITWKKKCDDPLFQPESAYLHQQQLYIASPRVVTIFATKDGAFEGNCETDRLVKDCLGLCVIDDKVAVISSNSEDFEESKIIGFVPL